MNVIDQFLKENSETNSHKTIAIDLDGVLHSYSRGWADGTLYDIPILGTEEALKKLKSKFKRIIIFTCRMRKDQPKVHGRSQEELIWEWLEKYNLKNFVSSITAIKPYASYYIDDRAIHFKSWIDVLNHIK